MEWYVQQYKRCSIGENTKSYFQFENWWLETELFSDRVTFWWTSFVIEERPSYILATKLKALKDKLKEWSSSTCMNLEMGKILILNQITELDKYSNKDAWMRKSYQKSRPAMEFEDYAKDEEITWKQRSRKRSQSNGIEIRSSSKG